MATFLRDRTDSNRKPDPFWRASRIAVRLYLKKNWSATVGWPGCWPTIRASKTASLTRPSVT